MELETYFRFLLVLLFVLGLIGLFAWLARRFGLGGRIAQTRTTKERRLSIVEVQPLDGRRKLVLIRRDTREHLLVLSATGETVVETGIAAPADPASSFADQLAKESGR